MDKDKKIRELEEKEIDKDTYIEELEDKIKNMKTDLLNITTLHEISETYKIPVPTLKTRLKLSSFNLIEDIDYRRMGRGQSIIFTPLGVEKVIKKGWDK